MIWGVSTSQGRPRGLAEFLPEVLTRTQRRKELSRCEKGQLSLPPSWKGGLDTWMPLGEGRRPQGRSRGGRMRSHSSGRANTVTGGREPTRSTACRVLFLLSADLKCLPSKDYKKARLLLQTLQTETTATKVRQQSGL